jgi:hypothetical protein
VVVISLFHANPQQIKIKPVINGDGTMLGFQNSSFDPQTLVVLETAFDEAWLTLKSIGNTTVKPDELARYVLRLAMEGERDPLQKELRKVALRVILGISAFGEEIKKQTFPGRKDRAGVKVWRDLTGPISNPTMVRDEMMKSKSLGAVWDLPSWALIERIIESDRAVWLVGPYVRKRFPNDAS